MKILIMLLTLVSLDPSCSDSKINQDAISIEYTAHSRGFYQQIFINKKQISIENKRGESPITTTCSETDWNNLMKALKPIDIENIPNLKAPSEKRFYDGAAIANLKIIYTDETYETPSFDHGNPPTEIATLVKHILSFSENIE